jgi:hypothetical protein
MKLFSIAGSLSVVARIDLLEVERQKSVTLSRFKAEYVAMLKALKKRKFIIICRERWKSQLSYPYY